MSVTVNNCERFQCANDITIYWDYKVKNIVQATNHLECELCHLQKWPEETNLIFNQSKIKFIIIGTKQLGILHDLDNRPIEAICNKNPIKRVFSFKLFGTLIHKKKL